MCVIHEGCSLKSPDEAPVAKRDDCIGGAKDCQVLPNPLEDAPLPDFEQAEQVATPLPNEEKKTNCVPVHRDRDRLCLARKIYGTTDLAVGRFPAAFLYF